MEIAGLLLIAVLINFVACPMIGKATDVLTEILFELKKINERGKS